MGPSHTHHFQPVEPSHSSTIMTKIWTYPSSALAQAKLATLTIIQNEQVSYDCRIVCLHREEIESGRCLKVIAAFQYPSRSLRQEVIQRRKKGRHPNYFTQKQLQNILNLAAVFIINHHRQLCSHTDLLSNLFLCDGPSFKICHPELLPCFCAAGQCGREGFRQKMLDLMLELILLEKVVRGGRREVERGQYLYSHSLWIGNLMQKMLDNKVDILELCRESQFIKNKHEGSPIDTLLKGSSQNSKKQITTSFLEQFIPQLQPEPEPSINEFKLAQQTKASNSNRIRYYSHLSQFEPQKEKKMPTLNDLYAQKKQQKKKMLDQSQLELAQSIGDPEEHFGNSIILSPTFNSRKRGDSDSILDNVEMVQTHNFFIIEPLKIEVENGQGRTSRSIIKSYIPATIVQQQNSQLDGYSPDNSKAQSDHSEFQIIQQDGYKYQGQVLGGKKHGKGVFIYPNGVLYQGDWVQDQIEGIGSLYYPSGRPYYRGEWKDGNFNGRGIFYNQHPQPIIGGFNYRDFSNIGKQWQTFQGTFKSDKKHGQGLLTLSNGQTMLGQWRQDIIQGRGQFSTLQGEVIKGIWIENTLYLENS